MYTPLAERLTSNLRVLGMDDRGHGKTTAKADPGNLHNWDVFVEDMERFFDHLNEPVIAMGHSRGGVAALMLAIKRPELIRALILIDPTILPLSWKWPWLLAKKLNVARLVPIAARATKRKYIWPDRETILRAYEGKGAFKDWKDGFLDGYIRDGTEETGDGTIRLCCEPAWESRCFATCPHDVWRIVSRLQRPMLVLYGAESDTFLPPAKRLLQAKVSSTVFRRFEATSHFVPMERPDESAEAILNFLKDNQII